MALPPFLRSDAPVVLRAGWGAHPCATCTYWSKWLSETGDCLWYAYHRREAMLVASETLDGLAAFHDAWPAKSARVTSDTDCCEGWTTRRATPERAT